MSTDFHQLITYLEREVQNEGAPAVRELEQLRQDFRLASAKIAPRSATASQYEPDGADA
jgi:hypothetical protein